MNNELIKSIEILLIDNGEIDFDFPVEIKNDAITSIGANYTLFGEDNDYELEDLTEDELENLLYSIECQIEADNKTLERCRG